MIAIVNASTLVTTADLLKMTAAVNAQLRFHCASAWKRNPVTVKVALRPRAVDYVIGIADDSDQAGALGWHTETGPSVYGKVFVRPVLDNGGSVLTGNLSVSSVLSHEVLEAFIDPAVNLWADNGKQAVALEVGDPVEADSYPINDVMVSNFVLPAWFDSQATGPYDHMGKLTKPFTMTAGGYIVIRSEGGEKQVYADHVPDWQTPVKLDPLARTLRRLT